MQSQKIFQEQISRFDLQKSFYQNRRLKILQKSLNEYEVIEDMILGFQNSKVWLLVLTDSRIVLINRGLIYGDNVKSVPIITITNVTYEKDIVLGKIMINCNWDRIVIDNVNKSYIDEFVEKLNDKLLNKNN